MPQQQAEVVELFKEHGFDLKSVDHTGSAHMKERDKDPNLAWNVIIDQSGNTGGDSAVHWLMEHLEKAKS